MIVIFLLGFILEAVEIIYIVVPLLGAPILASDFSPVWFAILIAMNLQTSFLTPPFGFALFYYRSVAPRSISTAEIYRAIIPFVAIQIVAIMLIVSFPDIATWLLDCFSRTIIRNQEERQSRETQDFPEGRRRCRRGRGTRGAGRRTGQDQRNLARAFRRTRRASAPTSPISPIVGQMSDGRLTFKVYGGEQASVGVEDASAGQHPRSANLSAGSEPVTALSAAAVPAGSASIIPAALRRRA